MKIVLIQVWLGKIPDYFWFHYETTKNLKNIDFIFFTDQELVLDSPNYKVINTNLFEINNIISDKVGHPIVIKNNKKICDLKASYGDMFYEYIKDYDYFGCYDIDTLFGDTNKYLSHLLVNYDIISVGDEVYHNRLSGPFLIMRNIPELRTIYKTPEFIESFNYEEVTCYEEHILDINTRVRFNRYIIYDINCETENGGKNSFDAHWRINHLKVRGEEKFLYHFIKKDNVLFQKIGTEIFVRYEKQFLNDFYWVFGFSERYYGNVPYLLNSLTKYSNRRCIVFTINFDYKVPDEYISSEQFLFRRIEISKGNIDSLGRDENIIGFKPKLLLSALDLLPNNKFVYIDTDLTLTVCADDIKKHFEKLQNYPLLNSHIHDRLYIRNPNNFEEWISTLDILGNKIGVEICVFPRRKANIMIFDERSRWFLSEEIELYDKYKNTEPGIFAFQDEDSANILLSKYKFFDSLHLCDVENSSVVDITKFSDMNHPFNATNVSEYLTAPKHNNDVYFFHGLKDEKSFQDIERDYGDMVLDCEEIIVKYKDNTIFFEKNSFLTTKKIYEPVDFIISDLDGNIVQRLNNQELMNFGLFYISNVFLDKKTYIIEIFKSNSKDKIYHNLLKI